MWTWSRWLGGASGIGRPLGFLRWTLEPKPFLVRKSSLAGSDSRYRPRPLSRCCLVDQHVAQLRPVVSDSIGHLPGADQAELPVDRERLL